ncbi:MAG: EthD domain-containing protein [Mesorhizobium sp.]|nr:EthD domain-containing protein [Mesorhizobium sp.]MCO5164127.1 EthD domain-containing protein [Mesorhizobium sp.]
MRLKKIAFLTPRPGMSDPDFRAYWRGTHGPVVAGSPGYGAWRLRYAQNHIAGPGPLGSPFDFAGMAEFWLPGTSPNEDTFSQTPIYRDRIRVDELNFIDMERTVSMTATEQVVKTGAGKAKLVVLSKHADAAAAGGIERAYSDFAAAALAVSTFGSGLLGWTASHVVPGSFRLPGARSIDALAVDCVEEFWFSDEVALDRAFGSKDARAVIASARGRLFDEAATRSFRAEEIVFFDELTRA